MIVLYIFRWNIAIKQIKQSDDEQHERCGKQATCLCGCDDAIALLLDEAKIMSHVGCYHENIVNLQGITASAEKEKIKMVFTQP